MSIENNTIPDNPHIEVLKPTCSGIFTNYIYKAIPLAFDESMSYYETLLGLLHYLQFVIIPTVNNNAQAVAELQNLYIELKTYVENYFDNLDVQEEINNKLDAMVEDGTLENILNNYTQLTKVYNTYSEMINDENLVDNQKVKTLGYYNINDGGSAYYYITDTEDQDEIQFSTSNGLYATLIVENNTLYSKQFGIKGDGETDETSALQSFYDNNPNYTKVLNQGEYVISSTLYIKGLWRRSTGNNGIIKFKFDNASFKYTGVEDGYSVILYSMYKEIIENLTITQDSTHNKVGIIGCWYDQFNNINVDNLDISNDVNILNSRPYSTLSNEYCNFSDCLIRYGLDFNTSDSTPYTNAIHFYNCGISAGGKENVITVYGARHNQSLTFNGCDISYGTVSNFYIVSSQTGSGNIACTDCYFDSSIKMYKNDNPNNMMFTFINNMLASGGHRDKSIILADTNMLHNVVLGGITRHAYSLPSMNMNLATNGNFESTVEPTGTGNAIITQSSGNWTKEYVSSNKNINGRARKITSQTDTSNARLQILAGTTAPFTSDYTVFARFKILQMAETGTGVSMSVNGTYYSLESEDVQTGIDYMLASTKHGVINADSSFTVNLYFSDPTNLIIEFYEIGIIPGKMVVSSLPLHASAKLS